MLLDDIIEQCLMGMRVVLLLEPERTEANNA